MLNILKHFKVYLKIILIKNRIYCALGIFTSLYAPLVDLLTIAAAERTVTQDDHLKRVPCFDQKLPQELKDKIIGHMLLNALALLPVDGVGSKQLPVTSPQSLTWNKDGSLLTAAASTSIPFIHGKKMSLTSLCDLDPVIYRALIKTVTPGHTPNLIAVNHAHSNSFYKYGYLIDPMTHESWSPHKSREDHLIALSPAHNLLACITKDTVRIFDPLHQKALKTFPTLSRFYDSQFSSIAHSSVVWHPTQKVFAVGGSTKFTLYTDQGVKRDNNGRVCLCARPFGQGKLAWSSQGTYIARSDKDSVTIGKTDENCLFQDMLEFKLPLARESTIFGRSICDIQWSPDETTLAVMTQPHSKLLSDETAITIMFLNPLKNEILKGPNQTDRGFAWHPNGIYGVTEHGLFVWQPQKVLYDYFFNKKSTLYRPTTLNQKLFVLMLIACRRQNRPLSITKLIKDNPSRFNRDELTATYDLFSQEGRWLLQHIFRLRYKKTWYEYLGDGIDKL